MTLRELRGMVTGNKVEGRMISAKMLRESNTEIVCKEMINKDTDITVYKNGYVLYHTGSKCTVFVLPEKGCYSYDSVNVASVLDGDFFENEAWYFRLILEGEDRIAENARKKESKKMEGSYSQLEADDRCVDMADPNADFVARLLEEEYIDELMSILTVQQRTAIYAYYIEGMSQKQIAKRMNISCPATYRLIMRGIEKLRKYVSE